MGFTLPENTPDLLTLLPKEAWTEAYDAHDEIRDGAWVAELTGLLDLTGHEARRWEPKRLRLFTVPGTLARTARKVVPHLADRAPWASLAQCALTTLRAYPAGG